MKKTLKKISDLIKGFFQNAIRFYQRKISPCFPPACRYYPTCSHYALEAIDVHGPLKGSLLAIARLLRCNILFPGGYDPVPPKKGRKKNRRSNTK